MAEVLRGDLQAISLASVLQLAEAETTTGWLELDGLGRVGLSRGQPVAASCGAESGLRGLLELFTADPPTFRLDTAPQIGGAPLGAVIGLVMEGCRLADEWRRLAPMVLAPTGELPAPANAAMAALQPRLRGTRCVAEEVRAVKVARAAVVDPLLALLADGRLREVTAPPEPARAAAPPDYHVAMERGRERLRQGDFEAAEAAFEAALLTRPDDRIAAQNLRRARQVRSSGGASPFSWNRTR